MIRALLFTLITLTPVTKDYPHMNHLSAGDHQLVNPTTGKVNFFIDCGEDWATVIYRLAPRTMEVIRLNHPNGTPAYCVLTKTSKVP